MAAHLPRSWERYLNHSPQVSITPSAVQRDFARMIAEIGTPAAVPKREVNLLDVLMVDLKYSAHVKM